MNKIEELSPDIDKLKNLKMLDAWHNKIKKLPNQIGNLISLKIEEIGFERKFYQRVTERSIGVEELGKSRSTME